MKEKQTNRVAIEKKPKVWVEFVANKFAVVGLAVGAGLLCYAATHSPVQACYAAGAAFCAGLVGVVAPFLAAFDKGGCSDETDFAMIKQATFGTALLAVSIPLCLTSWIVLSGHDKVRDADKKPIADMQTQQIVSRVCAGKEKGEVVELFQTRSRAFWGNESEQATMLQTFTTAPKTDGHIHVSVISQVTGGKPVKSGFVVEKNANGRCHMIPQKPNDASDIVEDIILLRMGMPQLP